MNDALDIFLTVLNSWGSTSRNLQELKKYISELFCHNNFKKYQTTSNKKNIKKYQITILKNANIVQKSQLIFEFYVSQDNSEFQFYLLF